MPKILHFDIQLLIQAGSQFINIAIVIAVLGFILYIPVRDFLDRRRQGIADQIASAEEQEKQANENKALYESKLKTIETERNEILDSARKRVQEKEVQILAEAKKEAEALRNRAQLDIEREKEKAQDEMKAQIIQIASLMAGRYLSANMDSDTQNRLLDEVISELGDAKCLN